MSATLWIVTVGGALWLITCGTLLDVFSRNFPTPERKLLWMSIVALIPVIGPVVYFAVGRKTGFRGEAPGPPAA